LGDLHFPAETQIALWESHQGESKGLYNQTSPPSALAGGLGEGRIGAGTPVRPVFLALNFIASNEIIAQVKRQTSPRYIISSIFGLFSFGFTTAFLALLFPVLYELLQGFATDLPGLSPLTARDLLSAYQLADVIQFVSTKLHSLVCSQPVFHIYSSASKRYYNVVDGEIKLVFRL
jgi:hypothetical protein